MSTNTNSRSYIGKKIRPWDVDKILDKKIVGGRVRYLVKWRRTFSELNTWEIGESFSDPSMIEKFELEWQKRGQFVRYSGVVSRTTTTASNRRSKSTIDEESKVNTGLADKCSATAVPVNNINQHCKKIENVRNLLESELQCCICLNIFKKPCVTDCEHIFCDECIESWKTKNRTCPICRAILSKSEKKLIQLDNFIVKATNILKKENESVS